MINEKFQWQRQPKAEALVEKILDEACQKNLFTLLLKEDLEKHTSTRLFDWLDYVSVNASELSVDELESTGYVVEIVLSDSRAYFHPGAQLPRIVVYDHERPVTDIAVKVESIADFLMVRGLSREIEGTPLSPYRRCCVATENNISLWVIERRGTFTIDAVKEDSDALWNYLKTEEKWLTRVRSLENETEAFSHIFSLAEESIKDVGQDKAAWIVLECERKYWQARNSAGQIQKNRQDRLGMGWANHDHHTFRSSRKNFSKLVRLFEILGFHCRERFYAGEEAGWGAQVMENSRCNLVLFLDVDLDPHELEINFSQHTLPELPKLGTIGLWCELHGDSILKAGMHHLEAQFDHVRLTEDLAKVGVGMMDRFSDFPYLKQAFTSGEVWHVDPVRIERLLELKRITEKQAEKFRHYGAVGSHMENLQRREGYKGFNQKNVSFIIKKTDPRELT